MLLGRTTCK
ncbi:hypothetical protein FQN60_002550, partial [Etheostoma spectabile]